MSDDDSPAEADAESTDSTYWYIRAEARPLGPIFFSRLKQMARQGRLTAADHIKKGHVGDWVRACDVTGIEFPDPDETATAAEQEAAAQLEAQSSETAPGFGTTWIAPLWDRLGACYDELHWTFTERLVRLRVFASWLALAVVFVALSVLVARQVPFAWPFAPDPATTLTSIWDELKSKRQAQAPATEWDAFAEQSRHRLAPLITRLERSASAANRRDQQLLWAARDHLGKMLDDARTDASASEVKFAQHLQSAEWLKQGKDLHGIVRPGPGIGLPGFPTDATTITLGILFIAADLAIVGWFLRRR